MLVCISWSRPALNQTKGPKRRSLNRRGLLARRILTIGADIRVGKGGDTGAKSTFFYELEHFSPNIMHTSLSAWLAFSAALLPPVTAFYPYHYGDSDDSTSSTSRLRRTSQPSNPNARSVTLPLRRVRNPLRPRQNAYNIVDSNEPKQANSVAIDQDGGDLSYMVAVTFGDSKEEYHLLLDTAASNTWVMAQDCNSAACKTHNTFGSSDSSTLKVCILFSRARHGFCRSKLMCFVARHQIFQRGLRHWLC